jgi:hypothetical protein
MVSPDTLADTLIDIDILYAGSYVLQLIHGESYDVDVFCQYTGEVQPYTEQFWKIFAICKAKHELITRAFTTEPDEYDTNMVGIARLGEISYNIESNYTFNTLLSTLQKLKTKTAFTFITKFGNEYTIPHASTYTRPLIIHIKLHALRSTHRKFDWRMGS